VPLFSLESKIGRFLNIVAHALKSQAKRALKNVQNALARTKSHLQSVLQNRENLKGQKNPIFLKNRIFHTVIFS